MRPPDIQLAIQTLQSVVLSNNSRSAYERILRAEEALATDADLSRHPIQVLINAYTRLDPEIISDMTGPSDRPFREYARRSPDSIREGCGAYLDDAWRAVEQTGAPVYPFGRILQILGYDRRATLDADDIRRLRLVTYDYTTLYEMTTDAPDLLSPAQLLFGLSLHLRTLASRHSPLCAADVEVEDDGA